MALHRTGSLRSLTIALATVSALVASQCGRDPEPSPPSVAPTRAAVNAPVEPAVSQPLSDSAGRSFPSVFQAWSGIENRPDEDELELAAKHDLVFSGPWLLRMFWSFDSDQPWSGLSTELRGVSGIDAGSPAQRRATLRRINPNLKLLCEVRYREGLFLRPDDNPLHQQDAYPPDSPFWLRDENGNLCPGWGEDENGDGSVQINEVHFMLMDFRNPEFHTLIARKALAVKNTGLFDGIMLDWWNEDDSTTGKFPDWNGSHLTRDEELDARIAILKAIRSAVGDDFLILVNSNERTVPRSASYVNGLFMECWKTDYSRGYSVERIKKFESTLLWAEENLREPRINCLEGWRIVSDYNGDRATRVSERDSDLNQQWMRLFTTLSLTHSDGYVLFGDDNAIPPPDHLHNWYDFWDADLGTPVSAAGQRGDTEGLFIREFSNGWAVYNRSGMAQAVTISQPARAVNAGSTGTEHTVQDFDGEILLKINK